MSTAASPIRIRNPHQLFVGGRWVDARRGGRIELASPQREEVFATVAEASEPDVDAAVAAARTAFDNGKWPA